MIHKSLKFLLRSVYIMCIAITDMKEDFSRLQIMLIVIDYGMLHTVKGMLMKNNLSLFPCQITIFALCSLAIMLRYTIYFLTEYIQSTDQLPINIILICMSTSYYLKVPILMTILLFYVEPNICNKGWTINVYHYSNRSMLFFSLFMNFW